jgi:hypothetical protein
VILLTWPVHGLVAIFSEIIRQAEDALYDESALQAQLQSLYARLEANEISESEFERQESELAERLALAADYNRRQRRATH